MGLGAGPGAGFGVGVGDGEGVGEGMGLGAGPGAGLGGNGVGVGPTIMLVVTLPMFIPLLRMINGSGSGYLLHPQLPPSLNIALLLFAAQVRHGATEIRRHVLAAL